MLHSLLAVASCLAARALGGGTPWDRLGPWNMFNDKDNKGEAGTLACAASPATKPDVIYAGGQNNGVSSGIIKTVNGGVNWTRQSKGLWDTRVLGVWVHPDDPSGGHVFVGTHSGIYESTDAAESWTFRNETLSWGNVMSFREGVIQGKPYVLANYGNGIGTMPKEGGQWQQIAAPGALPSNQHLSVVAHDGGLPSNQHLSVVTHDGITEVLTCIGGWGGGQMYYATIESPTSAKWVGPITPEGHTYTTWDFFPGTSAIWGKCQSPTKCDPDVHPLGVFDDLASCQRAVNATTGFNVSSYTYQHKNTGAYAGHCYAISSFAFAPHKQDGSDSGRAPGQFPGQPVDCANAAVDPKDRDHFLFSKGGEFRAWESKDGGKTVREFTNHDTGVFFVMIDAKGWLYTATQAGAFVSQDAGASWNAYHVIMHMRDGRLMDRVPHDYQRIVPEYQGDGIAFPSDQGLHVVNGSSFNLTSRVGDMRNAMSLSAIISPNANGSRNLVVNLWDWNVGASWDDGATWAAWEPNEKAPSSCGEGGGGQGLGASGKTIMFHHNHWWSSADGGHNWVQGDLPAGGGSFDYVRMPGSRSEPNGTCFATFAAPPSAKARVGDDHGRTPWCPWNGCGGDDDDDDDDDHCHGCTGPDTPDEAKASRYSYTPGVRQVGAGNVVYLMTSHDFGQNWTWKAMPAGIQAGALTVDPTRPDSLFALTSSSSCLSHSADQGTSWSPCSTAKGLTGRFSQLVVKDSKVMFMLRSGAVPLRTTDGGASWVELSKCAPLFQHGATLLGSLSWSGKTLVLHGVDLSAVGRGEYGTSVWKSTNDGDDWTDETGDLVTISPGPGVWYEKDFYFVTRGEGVTVKRNFDE